MQEAAEKLAVLKKWRLFAILLAWNVSVTLGSDNEPFELTILHTNDVHSHIEETNKHGGQCSEKQKNESKCVGGVARIVAKVKQLKEKHPGALFMNSGDFYQGTAYYTILKNEMVSTIMAAMNYSYVCLGNHEFDDGPGGLAPFLVRMKQAKISVVGTNTDFSKEPALEDKPIKKSVKVSVKGRTIGIIGAVLPQTRYLSRPGENVVFQDEIESFKLEAATLKKQGVNIIVAITHCGYPRDLEIIKHVLDVDVIIGGHTNTFLYTGSNHPPENVPEGNYPTVVKRMDGTLGLVVQAYCYGKFLGFLQATFDKNGSVIAGTGNPILLNASVAEDKKMVDVIEPYKKNVSEVMKKPVGYSKVVLEQANEVCRLRECNLGNLIADAYFAFYADMNTSSSEYWSNVNAALLNGGSIRAPLPQGDITMGDILASAPFGQAIVTVPLSGFALRLMFEHSVANFSYENKKGEFLQISGARVKYNLSLSPCNRVTSLKVLCTKCLVPVYQNVADDKNYTIVTNTFVAKGGDGFAKAENYGEAGPIDLDVLVEYIGKMSPIKTPIEGRIIIEGNVTTPSI
ncbi:5'-nucleotidase-like [Ixodes scapularis]|uniref:5'-nucleotidase-like n=1 Tax=Ixodes scapularis TaxID=6945 RepID=UPI001A9F725A|nr:5'-nucleotidase-like [Ixodes scapularis]